MKRRSSGPSRSSSSSRPSRSAHSSGSSRSSGRFQGSRQDHLPERVSVKPRAADALAAFDKLWTTLFTTPVHLDSALSKLAPRLKSILAQIIPALLLRPSSMAEALGVGVQPGEPWSLSKDDLAAWRPARLMFERCYEQMEAGVLTTIPIREDFPPWMIKQWEGNQGADLKNTSSGKTVESLVASLGLSAPLSLRVARQVNPSEFVASLKLEQLPVRVSVSDLVSTGVRLSGYAPILGTTAYKEGQFEIQDEGSQVLAHFALWPERFLPLLSSRPGESVVPGDPLALPAVERDEPRVVIDACAGAGGKTLALADALGGKGRVYAYDVSLTKLQALKRRSKRAGLNNVQVKLLDEGNEEQMIAPFAAQADCVLVDAPCSGWGVLRRNPDIKWRQNEAMLDRFAAIQLRLLSLYSALVAPGGSLVLGVCTFRQAETTDVVKEFLKAHPQFKSIGGGYLGPSPSDGFFMHAFKKD